MKEDTKKWIVNKPAFFLGLSFILVGCTLGISSLAWLVSPKTNANIEDMTGEATGSYFEKGDGTESNPYGIANAKQLYYFSWLQDMGYFNEVDSKTSTVPATYFELMDDIDASGYALPPCGTETYPFVSNFDAKNYTISNLTISNTIETDYITQYPARLDGKVNGSDETGVEQFNNQAAIVGFFGIIGEYTDNSISYDSSANKVTNLYLDNLTIKTKKSNLLVGIFAGYVNGLIDNCGVHYAKMDIDGATSKINGFNYVSEYTLIGSYNKTKYKWDQDSGSGSGGDLGYGTSTDIKALHNSLIDNGLNDGTTGKISKNTALPFRYENTTIVKGSGDTESVIVYQGSSTKKVSFKPSNYSTYKASTKGNNIGYYSGEVKTYQISSLDYNVDDFGIQSGSGYNTQNAYLKTPPDDVLEYLKENGNYLIRLNSGTEYDDIRHWSFNYIHNAQVGSWTGNLLIPTNGIWVAPKESGKFKFVFYNQSYSKGGSVGLLFMMLKRVTPGDYSSPFYTYSSASGISYSCKYGYFEYDASTDCEYFITFYTNKSSDDAPYIAYMDIGTEGGSGDTPSDTRTLITNFDFVTKENNVLTKIKNADGTAIEGNTYTKSDIFFEIDDTTMTRTFAWRRTTADGKVAVLYYDSVSTTVVTPVGNGNKKTSSDENCNS